MVLQLGDEPAAPAVECEGPAGHAEEGQDLQGRQRPQNVSSSPTGCVWE